MLYGDTLYSSQSWFKHNVQAVDSMPRNCLQDLTQLLHFVDNWEIDNTENWDNNMFDYPRYDNNDNDDTAPHCIKFSLIEDERNKRWQECVKFCCWITVAESRVGATLHSMAVTHGKLMFYKLYA